jgi:ureidoglycolate hydrolase
MTRREGSGGLFMETKEIRIQRLTRAAFKPFGTFLGKTETVAPSAKRKDLTAWLNISDFLDLHSKGSIGFLEVYRQEKFSLGTLEYHEKCAEAFLPLSGASVLVVAPLGREMGILNEEEIQAFLLDGTSGVFIPKGVWHWAPLAISDKADFLMLQNSDMVEINDIIEKPIIPLKILF